MVIVFMVFTVMPLSASVTNSKAEITALLHQFLDGATRNDAAIHQRFWADELVYTSSAGSRFGKAELMASVVSRGEIAEQDITMRYDADAIQVRVYGQLAVLTFTLIGQSDAEQLRFYNTGVLQQSNHGWQVISWQATKAS